MRKSHRSRSNKQQKSRLKSKWLPFESLESRQMLSAATNVVITSPFSFNSPLSGSSLHRTIATSDDIHDLKNGPMANAPELVDLFIEFRKFIANGGKASDFVSKQKDSYYFDHDRVLVTVRGLRGTDTLATMLTGLGSRLSAISAKYGTVEAYVPITELKKVSRALQVASLSPVHPAVANTAGSANNQADETQLADLVRSTFGLDGTGIKIGVLSDSVNQVGSGIGGSVATGDLPKNGVQVIEDGDQSRGGGILSPFLTDEGRAMLELIHDIAPGASLAFATAYGGQQHFADNITALADAGCDIIVDDVGYFEEPFFQPGVIDQAIAKFVQFGGVYLSSAGNASDSGIQQSIDWVTVGTKQYVDFDPGPNIATRMGITISSSSGTTTSTRFTLEWDNPYNGVTGNATADVDLYIYDAHHPTRLVASSTTNNLQTHVPVEFVNLPVGDYEVQLRLFSSTTGQPLPSLYKINLSQGVGLTTEFAGLNTSIIGHNGGLNTISVGAVPFSAAAPYGTPPVTNVSSESFSSVGPVTQVFDAEGNRLTTPTAVQKPDISGIDAVNTSFFLGETTSAVNPIQGDSFLDPDAFPNFSGTSAAAPNVAAVVALMLQAKPDATQDQILSALKATAGRINGTPTGQWDPKGGFGLVNAYAAIQQFIQAPTAHFVAVSPNPRSAPVTKIKLVFSQQVSGFDVSSLNLHQPGGPNLLTGNNSPTTTDGGKTWFVNNLGTITSNPGSYVLTLSDDFHVIVNATGLPLSGGATTSFVIQAASGIPDAPTNLRAQAVTSTSVQLKWNDNSFSELGFELQRSENQNFLGTTVKTYKLGANKTSFTDTLPASVGKIYYYRVRAFGSGTNVSTYSNTARLVSLAPGEIVLDNSTPKRVVVSGPWVLNTSGSGFVGDNYLDDLNNNKGKSKVTYTPAIEATGDYYVYARWTRANDRATNVPVTLSINGKIKTITVNQRNTGGAGWVLLGRFHLLKGTSSFVRISNGGTNGRVTADAVRFQPASA